MGRQPRLTGDSGIALALRSLLRNWAVLVGGLATLVGLCVASRHSYLLFHSLAEGFSIVVAGGVFMLAWNSRRLLMNGYLLFLGIAYLFVAILDSVHTLAYPGMGVLQGYDTNLSAQLWVGARFLESLSLLAAPLLTRRKVNPLPIFLGYAMVTAILLFTTFYRVFPTCFVEGEGLTRFKKVSEYVISSLLVAAGVLLYRRREHLDKSVFTNMIASIALTVGSEMAFTLYASAYGSTNLVGHLLKIASFYFVYRAIVRTGLMNPYDLLFRDLRQSEEALRTSQSDLGERLAASEYSYRVLFETAPVGIGMSDGEGRLFAANRRMLEITGYTPAELRSISLADSYVDPQDCSNFLELLRGSRGADDFEAQLRRKDGTLFHALISVHRLVSGDSEALLTTIRDIDERKRLEAQLLQSQKLEAVGRLAGGIAHDFNNMMQVVTGYARRALKRLKPGDPQRGTLEEIEKAGERAASLTRQLLALGRRQVLQPRVLDINAAVSSIENMLQRVLGDDIDLVTVLQPDIGRVKVDPARFEQVLVNLALNARDAMPRGGKLTIETKDVQLGDNYPHDDVAVPPGPYVMLAVGDTGCGMDDETLSRIFEPFFTTKALGEGSGLGLAMVYGTVRQSGGVIRGYSEPGNGTTFKTFLPRVEGTVEPQATARADTVTRWGTETILLVEDDDNVRSLLSAELRDRGYQVVEACNGREAILRSRTYDGTIDLLITDVVLPGRSGREVHEDVLTTRPGLRALFISGHAADHIVDRGVLDPHTCFLEKPFTDDQLAAKVREALGEEGTAFV